MRIWCIFIVFRFLRFCFVRISVFRFLRFVQSLGGSGRPWAARGGLGCLGAAWVMPFRAYCACVLLSTLRCFPSLCVPLHHFPSLFVLLRLLRVLCALRRLGSVSGGPFVPRSSDFLRFRSNQSRRSRSTFDWSSNVRSIFEHGLTFVSF